MANVRVPFFNLFIMLKRKAPQRCGFSEKNIKDNLGCWLRIGRKEYPRLCDALRPGREGYVNTASR